MIVFATEVSSDFRYLTDVGLEARNLVRADNCSVGISGQSVVMTTGNLFARCTIFFCASVGFIPEVSVKASVPLGRYSSSLLGIGPPESVKLDFQNMLSRQRYFAKASNYPKQVTNSEKGRKKPIPPRKMFSPVQLLSHLCGCKTQPDLNNSIVCPTEIRPPCIQFDIGSQKELPILVDGTFNNFINNAHIAAFLPENAVSLSDNAVFLRAVLY